MGTKSPAQREHCIWVRTGGAADSPVPEQEYEHWEVPEKGSLKSFLHPWLIPSYQEGICTRAWEQKPLCSLDLTEQKDAGGKPGTPLCDNRAHHRLPAGNGGRERKELLS